MRRGDLVKVTIFVDGSLCVWPPPEEYIGTYLGPDHEYQTNHLVMYDGGVWTTPDYQIEVLT
jgi:hypothetical protein